MNISFGGNIIFEDTKLIIKYGEHYCLIGKNGVGKTTLLNAIAMRSINVPTKLDIVYVRQEEQSSNVTVIDSLVSTDSKLNIKHRRLIELDKLLESDEITDEQIEEHENLYKEIGNDGIIAKIKAQKILLGLGFSPDDITKEIADFSGGWRMRIALAKALFMTPTLLILDEPTNHLDLNANIWLSSYLKTYPKILLVVSHDQYFINEIGTTIIHIEHHKLNYYNGNYDKFLKQYDLEKQKIIKDWKHAEKVINKMQNKKESDEYIKKNNIIRPEKDYAVKIDFFEPNQLKGNILCLENVSFEYDNNHAKNKLLFKDTNLEIGANSRISIVGKNGVGKSTLLKLLIGELQPTKGTVIKNSILKIGYYNQHFEEGMDPHISGVDLLQNLNKDIDITTSHKFLSLFGLEPKYHNLPIGTLSGGQKARVKFASFGVMKPHILILDEPSNHLDINTLDSFIIALNKYSGAVIIVTHNFELITRINCELYVVDNGEIYCYDGEYDDYIDEITKIDS